MRNCESTNRGLIIAISYLLMLVMISLLPVLSLLLAAVQVSGELVTCAGQGGDVQGEAFV